MKKQSQKVESFVNSAQTIHDEMKARSKEINAKLTDLNEKVLWGADGEDTFQRVEKLS